MITRFLMFLTNLLFCGYKPLFIPIKLYFIKMHIWRVKMFHKIIQNAWNLLKLSEQSLENSAEILVSLSFDRSRVLFNWLNVLFDRLNVLFDQSNRNRIAIESSRDSRIIFLPLRSIKPKFRLIENTEFRIFT